jgi:hypothetical protein
MANEGISGYGATLSVTNGTATTLAQITKIGCSPGGITDIDISTMSGLNKWKQFLPGMIEAGELTCEANLEDAQETKMLALVGVTGCTWTVTFNDAVTATGSTFVCNGYLKPFGFEAPMDGAPVSQTFTIKLSGKPTVAVAT